MFVEDWKRTLENVKFHCEFFNGEVMNLPQKPKFNGNMCVQGGGGRGLGFTYLNEAMATLLCKWAIGTRTQRVQFEDIASIYSGKQHAFKAQEIDVKH
jgi:hypothetical protein